MHFSYKFMRAIMMCALREPYCHFMPVFIISLQRFGCFFIAAGKLVRKHLILWPLFLHSSLSVTPVTTFFLLQNLYISVYQCVVDKGKGSDIHERR